MPNAHTKESNGKSSKVKFRRSRSSSSQIRGGGQTSRRHPQRKIKIKTSRVRSARLRSNSNGSLRGSSSARSIPRNYFRPRAGQRSLSNVQSINSSQSMQFAGSSAIKGKIAGSRLSPYAANILLNVTLPFDSKPVRIRSITESTSVANSALFKNYSILPFNYQDYSNIDLASQPVVGELYTSFTTLYSNFPLNIYAVMYRNPYILMSYPEPTGCYANVEGQERAMYFISQASATPDYSQANGFQLAPPVEVGGSYLVDVNVVFSCPRWRQETNMPNSTPVVLDDMIGIPAVINSQNLYLPWLDVPNIPGVDNSNRLAVTINLTQHQQILASSLELVIDKYLPTSSSFLAIGRAYFPATTASGTASASVKLGRAPDQLPNDGSSGYYRVSVVGSLQSLQAGIESYLQAFATFSSFSSVRTKFVVNPHFPVSNVISNRGKPLISNTQIIGSGFLFQNQTPEAFKGGNVNAVQPTGNLSWSRYTSSIDNMETDNLENNNFYNGNFDVGLYGFVKPIKSFGFRPAYVMSGDNINYPFCPGIIQTPEDKGDGFAVVRITPPQTTPGAPLPQCAFRISLATIYEGTSDSQLFHLDASNYCPEDVASASSYLVRISGFVENPLHLPTIVKGIGSALKKGVHWLSDNKDWISAGLDAVMSFF